MSNELDVLRRLPLFEALPEADLEQLAAQAQQIEIGPNAVLIEEGAPGDAVYVLLDGELQVTKRSGAHDVKLDVRRPGEFIGEMSLLDNIPRSASVHALRTSRLLTLSKEMFERVLATSPTAALAILRTVTTRLRQNEAMLHEKEKMAGLGTLAAGLAHEINNPAAAVGRATAQLRELLLSWQQAMSALDALELDDHQRQQVTQLRQAMAQHAAALVTLDPLSRADLEAAVERWLAAHGVPEAWNLAPTLVSFGWGMDDFERLGQNFSAGQIAVLAQSLGLGSAVYALLDQIAKGSERISEVVKAVKSYSYLDRAPVQEVNVHEGLDSTLVILRHKLKPTITVTRDYAPGLPRIEAYAGELNQVWTNIIDNAVDALGGSGEVRLTTCPDDDGIVVEIADNGPGIPPEIQSRVFEAFFTTKPPGIGTGLGLNIAYNIVNKHGGDIQVKSRSGETRFLIRLPLRLPKP
ncbi:MAG: cyclic nucleotide-binding domain-containing protein [Anaerolineales bacterium]|nr:cyclic nucleotide-binding domain-containing protein [Anaerolineales bacterium]